MSIQESETLAPVENPRPFSGVQCIKCGVADNVRLDLENLTDVHCADCDETFTTDDVRGLVREWARILAWIEMAKTIPSQG